MYQLDEQRAHDALVHMSIYAHGYASLLAGGQLTSEADKICKRVIEAHNILISIFKKN